MKLPIDKSIFYMIFIGVGILLLSFACLPEAGGQQAQGLAISNLTAEYPNIYPRGYTDITCTASSISGGELRYKWSSSGGTLVGEGQKVRWEAPNMYGDYNIMVVVEDGAGHSTQGTVTVSVILKPEEACCGRAR
jgi:hypothetical protein